MEGLKRIIKAVGYSVSGLIAAYKKETAFKQEVWMLCILLPAAFFLDVALISRVIMIGSMFLVMITELVNSGIEAVVDYISQERHPLAKHAKDVGSAAVFVSIINLLFVCGMVLFCK